MKIEFKRTTYDGEKHVELYVGGRLLAALSEARAKVTDWKNATEAEHACKAELNKWLEEDAGRQYHQTSHALFRKGRYASIAVRHSDGATLYVEDDEEDIIRLDRDDAIALAEFILKVMR